MISPGAIKSRLMKRWESGQILAEIVEPSELFPISIPLGCPTGAKLSAQFSEVGKWAREIRKLANQAGAVIVFKSVNHRILGNQDLPGTLVFESPTDVARLLDHVDLICRWRSLIGWLLAEHPKLRILATQEPFALLDAEQALPSLLAVFRWLESHPHPDLYLREVDLPSIDTKLIETHYKLLDPILTTLLPAHAINDEFHTKDLKTFAQRFGFRVPEALIRYRLLDPHEDQWPTDLAITLDEFQNAPRSLTRSIETAIITENKINGLTLPPVANSIAIFGLGYGIMSLARCDWLNDLRLIYWGDLDTHGFAILSRLRSAFSHVESILMDRDTLMSHRNSWVTESAMRRHTRPLDNLTDTEAHVFEGIRNDQWSERVRLEQEFIRYGTVLQSLRQAGLRVNHE